MSSGTQRGIVQKWLEDKGYGFIQPDAGGDNIFVHRTDINDRVATSLSRNERVEFSTITTGKGLKAIGVRILR